MSQLTHHVFFIFVNCIFGDCVSQCRRFFFLVNAPFSSMLPSSQCSLLVVPSSLPPFVSSNRFLPSLLPFLRVESLSSFVESIHSLLVDWIFPRPWSRFPFRRVGPSSFFRRFDRSSSFRVDSSLLRRVDSSLSRRVDTLFPSSRFSPSSSILCIALQKHFHFSRFLFSLLFSFQQKNFGGVCHHMMSNFWVCGNLVGLDFSHPIRCFSTVHHLFRVCTRQRFTVGRALDSYAVHRHPQCFMEGGVSKGRRRALVVHLRP